jgi:hypothetical protein
MLIDNFYFFVALKEYLEKTESNVMVLPLSCLCNWNKLAEERNKYILK